MSFSKKERAGILILFLVYGSLWVFPFFFFSAEVPEDVLEITPLQIEKASRILMQYRTYPATDTGQHDDNRQRNHASPAARRDDFGTAGKAGKGFATVLDINTADSMAFEALPGIGEKLSSRIVRYRERLGGFASVDQLKEVYGLHDSVLQRFNHRLKVEAGHVPQKIKLNTCTYPELRKHPYVTHVLAKSILAFKAAHGPFKSKEDLLKIASVDVATIGKLLPYCSFEE